MSCAVALWLSLAAAGPVAPRELSTVRVGNCAPALTAGQAPFALAIKRGWFAEEGIEVKLVGLPGSSDCVKNVATGAIPFAVAAVEPQAAARVQGVKAKTFYTAYQRNIFGLAVPADSPIQKVADLRGKTIGIPGLGGGMLFTKALIAAAGMNPESDVKIVVTGGGPHTAAMVRGKQVDALCHFDTQFAAIENAGIKLRMLDTPEIDRFPGNGFFALEETLKTRRREAIALARAYAKGTVFSINNPEAAVRILYEVFPETRPPGKNEAAAVEDDTRVLLARIPNWQLERAGVKRWGESSEAAYEGYLEFLLKWGVINERVAAKDLITNELIDEINKFDANDIAAAARNQLTR